MARLILLVACLMLAACAPVDNAGNQDQDRHNGFYGGVTGGITHP